MGPQQAPQLGGILRLGEYLNYFVGSCGLIPFFLTENNILDPCYKI